jgi:ferric-dicitrate binding protein FerR (iron transport regulator)
MLFSTMEKQKKYQSINQSINQSVRYYRVPASVEKGAALNLLLNKISQAPARKPKMIYMNAWFKMVSGVAAAAVLLLAILFFTGRESLTNDTLQAMSYRLPDQSRVVLATGSSLRFHRYVNARQVKLSGEGYFEVTRGNRFVVTTSGGSVRVLGTRFSITEEGNSMMVNCYEGRVEAVAAPGSQVLQAGQGAVVTSAGIKSHSDAGTGYPSIAIYKADFHQTELNVVLQQLAEFFDVDISSENLGGRRYTGTFETGSLENALILTCEPFGLSFRMEGPSRVIVK